MRAMIHKAQKQPKRDGLHRRRRRPRSCAPARSCWTRRSPTPSCSAIEEKIRAHADELHLHLDGAQIVDPATFPRLDEYIEEFYSLRQRKGITRTEAAQTILNPTTFGSMMVRLGDADALDRRPHHALSRHHPARACR